MDWPPVKERPCWRSSEHNAISVEELIARRLTYGQPPEGFEHVKQPGPLEAGAVYTLVVAGEGRGQLDFRVSQSGAVTRIGP